MQYEDIVHEMRPGAAWIINDHTGQSREGVRAFQEKRKSDVRRWEK